MKSTGIIRKVDDLGRIVLPIELRRTLDIAERDELEIYMENDRIILQEFEPACVFCGSSRALVSYHGKNVCQACIKIWQRVNGCEMNEPPNDESHSGVFNARS